MSPKDTVHQTSSTGSATMLSAIASDGSSEASSGGDLLVQQQQQMQPRLGGGQTQPQGGGGLPPHQGAAASQQQPSQQPQHMHHHQLLEVHGNCGDGKNELDELTASTTQTNTNIHSASNNTNNNNNNNSSSSNNVIPPNVTSSETPPPCLSKSTSTIPTFTSTDSPSTTNSTSCATYSNYSNSQNNFQQHVNSVEPQFDSSVQSSNSNSQVEELTTVPTTSGSSPASTMDIDLGSTTSSISSLNDHGLMDDEAIKYEKAPTPTSQGVATATSTTSVGNQSTTVGSSTTSTIVHSFANAANIANSFINISNLSSSSNLNITPMAAAVLPVAQNTVPVMASVTKQSFSTNLIVSQPVTHFMKALTLSSGGAKSGIFVPNVIATNISPQFTVHHHHAQHHTYGLHHHHHGSGGPAPNVTVNPNGNFNTNPSSALRPGTFHGQFRPFLQHNTFSITGNLHHPVSGSIQSPILAAQLQTINQIATNQAQQHHAVNLHEHTNVGHPSQAVQTSGTNTIIHYPASNIVMQQQQQQSGQFAQQIERAPSRSQSPSTFSPQINKMENVRAGATQQQYFNINNDQQIRVLTPSEIMRTLPSLPNQDLSTSYDSTPAISHQVSVNTAVVTMTSSVVAKETHNLLPSDKNSNGTYARSSQYHSSSSSTITTTDNATLTTTCSTPNTLTSCSSPIISAFSTKNSQTPPSTPNTTSSTTTSILHQTVRNTKKRKCVLVSELFFYLKLFSYSFSVFFSY